MSRCDSQEQAEHQRNGSVSHMTTADQPKVTTFRVDADVLARLDAYAAQTRRSRNSAVNYLLQVGLDAEDARNLPERPD
jgi:hypothetical protein